VRGRGDTRGHEDAEGRQWVQAEKGRLYGRWIPRRTLWEIAEWQPTDEQPDGGTRPQGRTDPAPATGITATPPVCSTAGKTAPVPAQPPAPKPSQPPADERSRRRFRWAVVVVVAAVALAFWAGYHTRPAAEAPRAPQPANGVAAPQLREPALSSRASGAVPAQRGGSPGPAKAESRSRPSLVGLAPSASQGTAARGCMMCLTR
jgi:hypothetical protein